MAQEINNISSAALAFLGDSVFEINIRKRIVCSCGSNINELNKRSKAITNAKAQSAIIEKLLEIMTEEETAIYKRARNIKSLSSPKSCSISEYRRATGLEALFGYLYLENRTERIEEFIDIAISTISEE